MKDTLAPGLKVTRRFTVDEPRTIDFLAADGGDSARVYATPALIQDIEQTCRDFLLDHLDDGEDTLGTEVSIKHLAPTLLGMWAEVTAEVTRLDERALSFAVTVRDPVDELVASGSHDRFVIDVAKTLQRLRHKEEAFAQAS
ncbi:MAG: thioesterase family protein [Hyphomicrobiales bacterium]